jgi:GMP synthase-like glutamine amidotransferase
MRPLRPLRVEVFQHVPFEGLGSMEAWFADRGHIVSHTRLYDGDLPAGVPDVSGRRSGPEADWIIVMGGPMGVHDEAEFPWLRAEKSAIEAALARGASVLGVCLGAQLLAQVLGARVGRNREREIGWFPVDLDPGAAKTWVGRVFPSRFAPFHWHGDTFAIPEGAIPLGRSEACDAQGFLYRENVLGLQFHPEITPQSLEGLMRHCGGELSVAGGPEGRHVQDAEALKAGLADAPALNAMMAHACERLEARAACT